MKSVSSRGAGRQHFITTDPPSPSHIDKLEKRRMALLILSIAVAAFLGAEVIASARVPAIFYMMPALFDFF